MKILKVSNSTKTREIASCIYSSVKNGAKELSIQAVGVVSVATMVKAIIVTSRTFANEGIKVESKPDFVKTEENLIFIEYRLKILN